MVYRYVANTVIQLVYGQKNSEHFLDLGSYRR